jgi:hypothetical protein
VRTGRNPYRTCRSFALADCGPRQGYFSRPRRKKFPQRRPDMLGEGAASTRRGENLAPPGGACPQPQGRGASGLRFVRRAGETALGPTTARPRHAYLPSHHTGRDSLPHPHQAGRGGQSGPGLGKSQPDEKMRSAGQIYRLRPPTMPPGFSPRRWGHVRLFSGGASAGLVLTAKVGGM